MGLLARLVLAVVVGVIVTLLCILFGGILALAQVAIAAVVGGWLERYGAVLGILAALWFFFAGYATGPTAWWPRRRVAPPR